MPPRPIVLITEGCASAPLEWLRDRYETVEAGTSSALFDANISQADGLLVRTYTGVNAALLARAPRLRVVGRGGVGLENIDIPACRARNVEVVYTPDANTLAVGDLTLGAILRLIRPWAEFHHTPHAPAEFKRLRDTLKGRQLNEMTIGILGMGRVGRRVGHLAAMGFGARVIFHDIADVGDLPFPATRLSPEQLYRQSDVLTIHTDLRPGNRHLVGAPQLALLPPGAIVINHARGELLDAHALAAALRSGHLAGAALDVYDPEPPGPDFPLLGLPNVILTPHIAARTTTALEAMSWVVKDIDRVLRGEPPRFPAP